MESKKEIEKLLFDLKILGWGRKQIEKEFGYNPNYISQALSKGGNNRLLLNLKKLLKAVQVKGPDDVEIEYEVFDVGIAVKEIRATTDILLSAVAEILANITHQSSTVVHGQLVKMVNDRLGTSGSKQQGEQVEQS